MNLKISSRLLFIILFLLAATILSSGLILGHMAGLRPCYLCNFQRLLYILLAFFALTGSFFANGVERLFAALATLAAMGGLVSALYQSWMQYAPDLVTACGFGPPPLHERIVDMLAEWWPSMFMVLGDCSNTEWVFLKLSLANWSAVCFALLLGLSLYLLFRQRDTEYFSRIK